MDRGAESVGKPVCGRESTRRNPAPFAAHCFNSYVGDAIFSVWRRLRQCPPAPTNLQREVVKAVL